MTITKAKCTTQITDVRLPLPEHIHLLVNQKSQVVLTTVGWSYVPILFRCTECEICHVFPNMHRKVWWYRNPHGDILIFRVMSCPTQLFGKWEYLNNVNTHKQTHKSVHTHHATVFPFRRNVYLVTWQCRHSNILCLHVAQSLFLEKYTKWRDVRSTCSSLPCLLPATVLAGMRQRR